MKEFKFVVNAEKEMLFIADEKRVPQYDKKWGTDKRISFIPAGFKYSRTFLADKWLSTNA